MKKTQQNVVRANEISLILQNQEVDLLDKAIVVNLYKTALRINEFNQFWTNLYLDQNKEIILKNKKQFKSSNKYFEKKDDIYLNILKKAKPLSNRAIQLRLNKLSDLINIKIQAHGIRRGKATDLAFKTGLTIYDISIHLNHENVETTQLYIKRNSKLEIEDKIYYISDNLINGLYSNDKEYIIYLESENKILKERLERISNEANKI